jgi:CRP-like cAMP-binding protein
MMGVGETLARHLASFGEMPAADFAAVAALQAEVRDLPRQTDLLRNGDQPTQVVVVLSGLLYRYTIGPEGKRQIHSFYLANEAPSLETLYIDYMDNNLGTVVPTRVGLISHDQIYRIIDERPEARKLLWRQTLVQAAIFRQWLVRNSNLPAHMALAHLFCEMFVRADAAGLVANGQCSLPLTQEFVADALGLTAVHTNRTLQALRETGAVEWRSGQLTVHDWPKLSDIARFDPSYLHLRSKQRATALIGA